MLFVSDIRTQYGGPSNKAVVTVLNNGSHLWTGPVMNSSYNSYSSYGLAAGDGFALVPVERWSFNSGTLRKAMQLVKFNASGYPDILRQVPNEYTDTQVASYGES